MGVEDALDRALQRQRQAFLRDGHPGADVRIERLERLAAMVLAHAEPIVAALSADFGTRSAHATRTSDVVGAVAAVRHNREHLATWMRPVPVALPETMEQAGARAEVRHLPLGVIGAIVPWNGPVLMAVLAAAGALAAGNRIMIKAPEGTPRTSALLASMFAAAFSEEEVRVVQGDAEVGAAFSRLRFDHLLFTGSAATARHVAAAAARNLVPVTLELGGRNPVIVGRGADLVTTAARLVAGKMASAGQVCVAPDYVLAPRAQLPALLDEIATQAARLYPRLLDNDDCTSIASAAHFERLHLLLDDARRKGARVVEVNPAQEAWRTSPQRKFPLCLVTGVTPDMRIAEEETFGPLLSLQSYDRLEHALSEVARLPQPLSAYFFGTDAEERERVVQIVPAGNMVVDDVRCQLFFEQLPFGGVGTSGHGRYRGHEGFRTFSNAKTVMYQALGEEMLAPQRPPYSPAARAAVEHQIEALRRQHADVPFPKEPTPRGDPP